MHGTTAQTKKAPEDKVAGPRTRVRRDEPKPREGAALSEHAGVAFGVFPSRPSLPYHKEAGRNHSRRSGQETYVDERLTGSSIVSSNVLTITMFPFRVIELRDGAISIDSRGTARTVCSVTATPGIPEWEYRNYVTVCSSHSSTLLYNLHRTLSSTNS